MTSQLIQRKKARKHHEFEIFQRTKKGQRFAMSDLPSFGVAEFVEEPAAEVGDFHFDLNY